MTTWCRFSRNDWTGFGLVEGDRVTAIEGVPWGEHKPTARAFPLAQVKLLVPVVPSTFYCVGINYATTSARWRRCARPSRYSRRSPTSATAPTMR